MDELVSLIGYVVGVLITCIIFGAICDAIVKNKGYEGGGFLWGFFLTWIGIIICALKPQAPREYTNNTKGLSYSGLNNGSTSAPPPRAESFWNCSDCGARNSDAYTTCYRCGKNRYQRNTSVSTVHASTSSTSPYLEKKAAPESTANDTAAQIKEFKKLLDEGLITEEEFAAKKKQILGI